MLQDLDPYYFYSGRDVEDQLYGIYSQIRVQDGGLPIRRLQHGNILHIVAEQGGQNGKTDQRRNARFPYNLPAAFVPAVFPKELE